MSNAVEKLILGGCLFFQQMTTIHLDYLKLQNIESIRDFFGSH